MRHCRHPVIVRSRAWVHLTDGCNTQEYVKVIVVGGESPGDVERVITAYGPHESYANADEYEYIVWVGTNNRYCMFQHLLRPENCIGLEYVANAKREDDIPQWLGQFHSRNRKYLHQTGVKFSVTDAFVRSNFSRFVDILVTHPNRMLDLIGTAALDKDFEGENALNDGWMLDPYADVHECPKFQLWEDRPKSLVRLVRNHVKNIFEVLYVPGSRWRFFGRFNHEIASVRPP